MADDEPLDVYREKRDFGRTAEPKGQKRGEAQHDEDGHRFVVQIHDASTLHFDFRLQVGDVLKSWSVPKGPSADPHDKRLAMPTEDHPLDYEEFEGVIPAGEYGGGTVIVWDNGTYRPMSHDRRGRPVPFDASLDQGHATFWLDGSKLHGEYALTRFRGGDGEREAWLLVKADDQRARPGHDAPDPRRARSVTSGRTLHQVAEQAEQAEQSERPE